MGQKFQTKLNASSVAKLDILQKIALSKLQHLHTLHPTKTDFKPKNSPTHKNHHKTKLSQKSKRNLRQNTTNLKPNWLSQLMVPQPALVPQTRSKSFVAEAYEWDEEEVSSDDD